MNFLGLLIVAVGVYSILGSLYDWEWFMNARKARFMSNLLSRNGARIFYGLFGFAMIVLGILWTAGIISPS